ncbi:MAG: hypothetical protein K6A43_00940 [Treponema sp.]|nr:hypothetical protein [Treponema sp.]
MKLKKLGWLAAVVTASAMLLASCNNITTSTVNNSAKKNGGEVPIALKIGNANEDGTLNRTLLPKELELSDINYFTLSGESQYSSFGPDPITGDDATALKTPATGFVKSFTSTYWHLTLRAYKFKSGGSSPANDDILMLQGTADIDLSTSSVTELKFSLTSYKVTTKGKYDIILNYDSGEWKPEYALKYGLYNVQTGEKVEELANAATATKITQALVAAGDTAESDSVKWYYKEDGSKAKDNPTTTAEDSVNYHAQTISADGITPGSYIFGVTFYDKVGEGQKEIGYYSDVILIEPGQTTRRAVELKSILGTVPKSPENLIVQRIIGSETDGYYKARFTWQDKSSNEKYFKLVIKEYKSTETDATGYTPATPIVEAETTGLVLDYKVYSQTDGDIRYEAGSLFAGNQELILTLPTGRLFDAEIFAVNNLGESDSDSNAAGNQGCKRVAAATGASEVTSLNSTLATTVGSVTEAITKLGGYEGKAVKGYPISASQTEKTSESDTGTTAEYAVRINLVQITYNLNGGVLKTCADMETATMTVQPINNFVAYTIYTLDTEASAEAVAYNSGYQNIKLLDFTKTGNAAPYRCADKIFLNVNGNATEYFCQLEEATKGWWSNWQTATQQKTKYTNKYNDLTILAGYAGNDIALKADIAKLTEIPAANVIAHVGSNPLPEGTNGLTAPFGLNTIPAVNIKNNTARNESGVYTAAIDATVERFVTVAVKIDGGVPDPTQPLTAAANASYDISKDMTKFKKFKLLVDGKELNEKSAATKSTYGEAGIFVRFDNLSTSSTVALQESGVHTVSVVGLLPNGKYCSNTFYIVVQR